MDSEDPEEAQPFLQALNVFEIQNLRAYRRDFPGQAYQLNQSAIAGRGTPSKGDVLQTVIRNLGLCLGRA